MNCSPGLLGVDGGEKNVDDDLALIVKEPEVGFWGSVLVVSNLTDVAAPAVSMDVFVASPSLQFRSLY